ncbi:MAG: YbaN family protein [Mangrovicoccus sp.]|nr:YbaN family protein [Mangrovicoccus sp.]
MRLLWLIAGFTALGLGLLGIALPLLPTVPFMLLAAFCFSRSSERLHLWLLNHPVYGPQIEDWQRSGAIHPRAKRMASVMIAAAFLLSVILGVKAQILMIQAVVLLGVLTFIWTRPDH